ADLLPKDPFQVIDFEGVGGLMRLGVEGGRKTRSGLKIGICGEHGGAPESVKFCHKIGLDYVSCSPFRVPIARLAAAQAALGKGASGTAWCARRRGGIIMTWVERCTRVGLATIAVAASLALAPGIVVRAQVVLHPDSLQSG